MIRSWVESHLGGAWQRLDKAADKSGLFSELKDRWMVACRSARRRKLTSTKIYDERGNIYSDSLL